MTENSPMSVTAEEKESLLRENEDEVKLVKLLEKKENVLVSAN